MSVVQQTTAAAVLTAGPFGALLVTQPQGEDPAGVAAVAAGMGAVLTMGGPPAVGIVTGLNFAGIAAVASAVNTYYGALSAAERAQVGYAPVSISQRGISIPCHNADVTSLAATLASVLDTSSNYGAVGT